MIAANHLLWTGYGWWLPNDPRGSMSKKLRNVKLTPLGEIHFGRRRMQPTRTAIEEFRDKSRELLNYPVLVFTRGEVAAIAQAFRETIKERGYTCYACAIMPEHVHILIRRHRDQAPEMIQRLQDASSMAVRAKSPASRNVDHPVWGGPGWKAYLETQGDIHRVMEYIRLNPIKIGRMEQRWDFVTEYDGWLPAQTTIVRRQLKCGD